MNTINHLNKKIVILTLVTAFLLLIPFTAMRFTGEVNWDMTDFSIMGMLIFGIGLMYILVTGRKNSHVYRIAFGLALATVFMLIWLNAAVGLVGSGANLINVLCFVVPVVGIVGAIVVRFRSREMVFVLLAMAVAQVLIAITGLVTMPDYSVMEILGVNGFFVLLFVTSAMLFYRAVGEETQSAREQTA